MWPGFLIEEEKQTTHFLADYKRNFIQSFLLYTVLKIHSLSKKVADPH
jgi:hypothetical protein